MERANYFANSREKKQENSLRSVGEAGRVKWWGRLGNWERCGIKVHGGRKGKGNIVGCGSVSTVTFQHQEMREVGRWVVTER